MLSIKSAAGKPGILFQQAISTVLLFSGKYGE